jgi:pimeloyl-ACP methyl ester carboxylesterase
MNTDASLLTQQQTDTAPDGTDTAPDGTDTAPDGTDTAPDGTDTAPDGTDTTLDAESVRIETDDPDGVTLHAVTAGDPDDPLVVLLHGFPDFWYGWGHQIPAFVDAGYRVVVPDQRGYNLSDKPDGVGSYRIPRLSGDVADVIRWTGRDTAHVVGHDWGAAVAWDLALRRPEVLNRLGICNVPHPVVFRRTLQRNPRQLLRSWYIFSFQLPKIPEWGMRRNDCAGLERALRKTSHEGAFTAMDLERYRAAWRKEGVVGSMIDWYRAAARYGLRVPQEEVTAPTQICWGEQDDALLPSMADESLSYCRDGHLEWFPSASHWVHMEEPERVNEVLLAHLRE